MKRILATLVFLSVSLSAWSQPLIRNWADTNPHPFAIRGIIASGATTSAFPWVVTIPAGGGSQTPWLQTEDAAGFSLTNVFQVRGSNAIFGIRDGTGTNAATGFGANILGSALGGTNQASGYGSLIDGVATNGGLNAASGIGSWVMGNSDNSINQASGYGASVVGNTTNLSLNVASGTGARVVGYASNGSTNESSGMGSSLNASADGGGYNQVTGNRSLSIGTTGSAGGKNLNNADDSLSISVAAGGTNQMDGLKSSTMLIGLAVGGGQNLVASDGFGGVTQGTSLLVGSAASKGVNTIFQHGNAGRNAILIGSSQSGGSNRMAASGIGVLLSQAGTNLMNSGGGLMFASTVANKSWNEANNGPNIFSGVASQGTNVLSAQLGILIGAASVNGVNLNSGTGGAFIGYAGTAGANTMNGTGGALISYSDSTIGGTANTSDRSFVFGAGGTNTANDAFAYFSRGTPLIFAATNRVGINTKTPKVGFDVNLATTHELSVTNLDLLPAQYMATDGGQREVSTLDGGSWTNIQGANIIGPVAQATTANFVTGDPLTNHVYYSNLLGSTFQTLWIDAGAMSVGATGGPSIGFYQPTNGANPYVDVWDFDATNPQTNYFKLMMPDSWDKGTVKLKLFYFQAAETSTGNSNVWAVCAKKFSKGDTLFGSGTEVSVTNSCVDSTNKLNVCTSPAVTISGTPAVGDMIVFQLRRVADSGWDTAVGYSRLTGVAMQWADTHTNSPAW